MTKYIAVDGRGGSGKTYLSELLASHLGAKVFHLDDYGKTYQPFIGIPRLIEELELASSHHEVIIYEGVGVFDERLDIFEPFRILVRVPEDMKRLRKQRRDVPRPDRSAREWTKIWLVWHQAEDDYFTDEVIGKADTVIGLSDGDNNIDNIVTRFVGKISPPLV